MSDNTELNPGTGGDIAATDDIGGVKYQRVKLTLGADGVNDGDVSVDNPVPTTGANDVDILSALYEIHARLGILETAKHVDGSMRITSLGGTVTTVGNVANITAEGGYSAGANVQGFTNNVAVLSNVNNCVG